MKISFVSAALAAALLRLSAAGTEANAYFAGTVATSVYKWCDASSWKDGYCPTNESDVVSLAGLSSLMMCIPSGSSFTIDSIIDAPSNTMLRFEYGKSPSRVTVRQMAGYRSNYPFAFWNRQNWTINSAYSGFVFTGDAKEPTEMNSYYLGTLPYFGVPSADGEARINRMMHKGMFVKEGPGELAVRGPVGPDSGAFVNGGAFVLVAEAETTDSSPAPGAYCHVDSSTNLKTFYDETSGRTYVTNWADVTQNGFSAYNDGWVLTGDVLWGCPHVSAKTVNGRPLIDFGHYRTKAEHPGDDSPSGALNWSEGVTNVREIFMAIEMKEDMGNTASVAAIGYNEACPFLMYSATNYLFKQEATVYPSDVRVDGSPLFPQDDPSDPFRVRVVSCKTPWNVSANAFGRQASNGRGGFLLGEALVYTNELTEAERRRTIAYLKKRWTDAVSRPVERAEWDFGDIALSNATVGVDAGCTVRVKRVQDTCAAAGIASEGIVKTGAGTLVVDRVVPSGASLSVHGGGVRFSNVASVPSAAALPSGALVNFDAESSAFDYESGSEEDVTAWYSLANGSKYVATNAVSSGVRSDCPKRVAAATPTGLHAVDFLSRDIKSGTATNPHYKFPEAAVYSGFIVWKNNYDKQYRASHFCDTGDSLIDRAKGQILAYKSNKDFGPIAGMNWRVNGLAVNPLDGTFGALRGDGAAEDCEWVLISFDASVPVKLNGMARSVGDDSGGGCLVAALVGYDRPLADHERRQAEAYLMNRWLGKAHPDAVAWNGALAFGEGVDNAVDTDADISPSEISFSSDSFAKSGSGSMSVGGALAGLSSVTVGEGSLSGTLPADLCAEAYAHFDASVVGTLEMTAASDGTYYVSKWHDVRRNGLYATADLVHCHSMPRYTTAAAAGILSGMGYVDFGPTSVSVSSVATNVLSAAMDWSEPSTAVREVHIVYADADYAVDDSKVGNPVGYRTGSNQSGFIRQYKKVLCYDSFQNMLCDAALDGETTAQTTVKPDGFGVVSLVVTNHCSPDLELGRIGTFCNERNLALGGCKIAEVIVFEKEQSAERRRAIDAMLLKKWRGIGAGAKLKVELPAVSVGSGASADIGLDGNDGLVALSRLDVVWDGSSAGTINVDGPVDLSYPATVALSFPAGSRPLTSGRVVKVLEAQSLVNTDALSSWTLVLPDGAKAEARLVAAGNAVYVRFFSRGAVLVIR